MSLCHIVSTIRLHGNLVAYIFLLIYLIFTIVYVLYLFYKDNDEFGLILIVTGIMLFASGFF